MFKRMLMAAGAAVLVQLAAAPAALAAPPIEAYARMPAMDLTEISPDGTHIAYVAADGDTRAIVVMDLTGQTVATAALGDMKVRNIDWADNDYVVMEISTTAYMETAIQQEVWQAASFNIRTQKVAQFFSKTRTKSHNVIYGDLTYGVWEGQPVAYVQGFTDDNEYRLDLYRINLENGYAYIHERGRSKVSQEWLVRPDGTVAAKSEHLTDWEERARTKPEWKLLAKTGSGWADVYAVPEEAGTIETPSLVGFGPDWNTVMVATPSKKGYRLRPMPLQAAGGAGAAAAGDEEEDDGDWITGYVHSRDGRLVGVERTKTYADYEFFEPSLQSAWALAKQAFNGRQVAFSSMNGDMSKLVLRVNGSGEPGAYYMLDVAAKKLKLLGRTYPEVKGADVAEVRQIKYKAADGLEIEGYLTLPSGREAKGLPLVVLPHGGPQSRDEAGFDFEAQALASRGYAVLQPNFRGSDGYGQDFVDAGHGQWGRKMQTDLSDGVKALAKQGTIDPKRVCIMGSSYGGYAALQGAALEPDTYRCSVSVSGVSDLARFVERDYRHAGMRDDASVLYWKRFMGVTDLKDPSLTERSPAFNADKIKAPVLLIHGKDDTVVPYEQSDVMAKALKSAGKPVEFVTLKGEDHHMSRSVTRKQMLEAAIAFIEKHNPPA